MPRVPTDYSKTCIYKLVHKDDINNENIYIGSTTNFRFRKAQHKSCCNCETDKGYNYLKYQYIRANGGWDMWQMIEIEKYPCNDKREAEARERYWIEYYKSKLNQKIPTRNIKEWRDVNRDMLSEQRKEYRQKNRDRFLERDKQYRQQNREKLLEQSKQYHQDNRDTILEQHLHV